MKKFLVLSVVIVGAFVFGACSKPNAQEQAQRTDQQASAHSLDNLQRTQPVPQRPYSQIRQNLIEIQTSQMDSTETTSFFFNQGVQNPVQTCPSIGYPIASTTQLTNPQQNINGAILPQVDPNGVYAGNSTGTYVICIDAEGRAYADYWEGFVQTVSGPAKWNETNHTVELVGPPSFAFTTEKK